MERLMATMYYIYIKYVPWNVLIEITLHDKSHEMDVWKLPS